MNRPFTAALLAALCALLALTAVAPASASTSRAACLRKASHHSTAKARSRARAKCAKPAAQAAASLGVQTVPAAPAPVAAPTVVTRAPAAVPAAPVLTALQQGLVDCANTARAQAGLPALRVDPALTRAAQGHALDMFTRHYFDHATPEGLMPWDRITATLGGETPFSTMGENIAEGFADAPTTCVGWMNSPGHRANILNPDYDAIGAGWSSGYAVQTFGG